MSRRNVIPMPAPRPVDALPAMARALLPWEDGEAFLALRTAFHREYAPIGPTETALVDQLTWLEWRRQRLLLGERAAALASLQDRFSADHKTIESIRRALLHTASKGAKDELAEAISSTPAADEETCLDTQDDDAATRRAITVLETGDPAAYAEALALVRADTAGWWEDVVADDEQTHPDGKPTDDKYLPYSRTTPQLLRFLSDEVLPIFATTREQLTRRPAIRLQAQGESLDPFRQDRILALDERLTRQFEKTLGMLLRLKDLRALPASVGKSKA